MTPAQFRDVFRIAVDHPPANARGDRGLGHLRHARADRLDQNCRGTPFLILNDLDELLRLIDGVIVGVNNFELYTEADGHVGHYDCLFSLVIVFPGGESNDYA